MKNFIFLSILGVGVVLNAGILTGTVRMISYISHDRLYGCTVANKIPDISIKNQESLQYSVYQSEVENFRTCIKNYIVEKEKEKQEMRQELKKEINSLQNEIKKTRQEFLSKKNDIDSDVKKAKQAILNLD